MNYVIKNIPNKNNIEKILNYFETLNNNINFSKIELDILKVIAFIIFEFEKNKEYTKQFVMSRTTPLILNSFYKLKKYNKKLLDLCLEIVNLYDEAGVYDTENLKDMFFNYICENKKAKNFFLGS